MDSMSEPCSGFVTVDEKGTPCAGFRECGSHNGTTKLNPAAHTWDVPLEIRCATNADLTTWAAPECKRSAAPFAPFIIGLPFAPLPLGHTVGGSGLLEREERCGNCPCDEEDEETVES